MRGITKPNMSYMLSPTACVVYLSGDFIGDMPREDKEEIAGHMSELEEDADRMQIQNGSCENFAVDITEIERLGYWGEIRIKTIFKGFLSRAKNLTLVMPGSMAATAAGLLVELSVGCDDKVKIVNDLADVKCWINT